jgi:hypothetical protein
MAMHKKAGRRKSISTWREIMQASDKQADATSHELAKLFRDIMATHGISITKFDNLADRYYRKVHTNRKGVCDLVKVSQEKSNLTRALASDSIPWFRFVTMVRLLGPRSYTFTLTMEDAVGRKHHHTVQTMNRFVLAPVPEEEDEPQEEEVPEEQMSLNFDNEDGK